MRRAVRTISWLKSHRIATIFLGGLGAVATAVLGQYLYEWWMVPDLSVTYAVGYEERGVRPAGPAFTYYYELRDLRQSCIVNKMSITLSPPNQGPRSAARLLLWLLIDNKGRRVASDVRLTVVFSAPIASPRLIATPQVSASLLNTESSARLRSYTIVVESISRDTPAVVVLSVPADREIYDALTKVGLTLKFPMISARELAAMAPATLAASAHELRDKESMLTVGEPSFGMNVTGYVSEPPPPEEGTAWYQALPPVGDCPEDSSHMDH